MRTPVVKIECDSCRNVETTDSSPAVRAWNTRSDNGTIIGPSAKFVMNKEFPGWVKVPKPNGAVGAVVSGPFHQYSDRFHGEFLDVCKDCWDAQTEDRATLSELVEPFAEQFKGRWAQRRDEAYAETSALPRPEAPPRSDDVSYHDYSKERERIVGAHWAKYYALKERIGFLDAWASLTEDHVPALVVLLHRYEMI